MPTLLPAPRGCLLGFLCHALLSGCQTRPTSTASSESASGGVVRPSAELAPLLSALPAPAAPTASPRPPESSPETVSTPSKNPPPITPTEDVVVLEPLVITAPRADAVAKQLRQNREEDQNEAAIARSAREGSVSRSLNGWRIPFFNIGMTADRLAEGADRRAEILAQERIVLLALRDAKTKEEREALKADLRALRDLRRSIIALDPRPASFGP